MEAYRRFKETLHHFHCSVCKEPWLLSFVNVADREVYLRQVQTRQEAVSIILW